MDPKLDGLFKKSLSMKTMPIKASVISKELTENKPNIGSEQKASKSSRKSKTADQLKEAENIPDKNHAFPSDLNEEQIPKTVVAEKRKRDQASDDETDDETVKKPPVVHKSDPEKDARTVFVGNLNVKVTEKTGQRELKRLFSMHGAIETIRFRSIAFDKPLDKKHRKIGFITRKLHEERDTVNAYVVYKSAESVDKALALNATIFMDKHIRVDKLVNSSKNDKRRSVFIGNLSFNILEEHVWRFFESCGEILNVRIVRDQIANVGKGFGYVQFRDRSTVALALALDGTALNGRPVRVQKCTDPEKAKVKAKIKSFEGEKAAVVSSYQRRKKRKSKVKKAIKK